MNDTHNTEIAVDPVLDTLPVVSDNEATLVPGDGETAQPEGTIFVAEDNEAQPVSYN